MTITSAYEISRAGPRPAPGPARDHRGHRRRGRRLGRHRLQGAQRPFRRRPGDPRPRRGGLERHRTGAAPDAADRHRSRSTWSSTSSTPAGRCRSSAGVESVAAARSAGRRCCPARRRAPSAAGVARRRAGPPAARRHARALRPRPGAAPAAGDAGRSRSWSSTPQASSPPRVPTVGSDNWAGGLRPPGTCWGSGTGGSPSSPARSTSCAAAPGSTATARPSTRPGRRRPVADPVRQLLRRRRLQARHGAC